MHAEVKLKLLNTFSCVATFYSPQRLELFENLEKVSSIFLSLKIKDRLSFLYGSQSATSKGSNHEILKFVINYIKETRRFDRPRFCTNQ